MKKVLTAVLVLTLVGGSLAAPATAKKKKKKPVPVAVDKQFFLRDADGCDSAENQLSVADGTDTGCWYADSGILYDAVVESGLLTASDLGQTWTAVDGVPLTLDVSKPITGEITTASGSCLVDGACSPAGIGAGQAALDVTVFATIAGEEKELGTFAEAFPVVPGATHTSKIEIPIDAALAGQTAESLRVLTYLHGAAMGHGIIVLDDPASFVTVPAFE